MAAAQGYRSLFADRRFTVYIAQLGVGEAGYSVYAIAIVWLALEVSGSLLIAGVVLGVEFGIYAISFIAGPFVDRVNNPRTILLIGYPLQALAAFSLGLLAASGSLTVPLLLVIVVLISLLWDFTYTASLAILPRIVPPERLFLANGVASAVSGGNQIAGYALGAGLILLVGPAGGAYLYALLNAVAAVLALALVVPPVVRKVRAVFTEFVEGWRFLFSPGSRPMLQLSIFSAMESFFSAAFVLVIALLAYSQFSNPSLSYSVLFTAFAIGGAVGGLALGQLNPRRRLGPVLVAATVAEGVGIVFATAAAPGLPLSVVLWFAVGVVAVVFYTAELTYIQAVAPKQLVGRTLANTYLFRGGSRAIGAVVVGALGGVLAPFSMAVLIGAVLVLVAGVGFAAFPAVRRLAF